ncbi:putative specificity protein s [Idiomarina baltica OS145]|uniref:Specificity protein s n=2 Tax=Idiomarina baltica TaxID=190892 RepID=A0ABM9WNU9_9GAMM|nr:putative specificity protein s [Idiomarina baltica OS145]
MTWNESTLGDICDAGQGIIKTGPFGSQLHQSDYSDAGTPVVMPKDIVGGRVSESSIARVAEEHVERLSHHQLYPGDIVYGRRGDIGRCALVTPRESGWLCGTGCLRIHLGNGEVSPKFLFYFLNNPSTVDWIYNQAVGATMPNLNTSILRSIPVRYPTRETQERIAAFLSAYDDLIENNTRRIEILEEMARRLYEEWFVHFRFPGHEGVSFKESELGDIPEGWEVRRLEDAVALNPRTKVPKEGEKLFVPMGALSESSMIVGSLERKTGNSGAKFQNGDTLFARITPCLENGKTGFVDFLPEDQPTACGSTEFIVLRSVSLCPEMVYLLARSDRFRDVAIKSMSGATGRQRVRVESLVEFPVVQPDNATLEAFQRFVSPCFKQARTLALKNANLRAQRDLLLPKLVSGEIDVSDIPMPDDREYEAA